MSQWLELSNGALIDALDDAEKTIAPAELNRELILQALKERNWQPPALPRKKRTSRTKVANGTGPSPASSLPSVAAIARQSDSD